MGPTANRGGTPRFPTTSWSLILEAGQDPADSTKALAHLCEIYWHPIYAYVRSRGYCREDAEDLTQEFFARMVQRCDLADVRRERGRFRSFLLASMRHFLANEWDRTHARKRGGRATILALDFEAAEGRFRREPTDELTPEALFERHWALTLLEGVLTRLAEEYAVKGQSERFEELRPFLTGSPARGDYQQAAAHLDLGGGALKVAVHRLRRRYGELLREEIAGTVPDPGQVDEEIRFLLAALGPR